MAPNTEHHRRNVAVKGDAPVYLVDPATNAAYVLVPAAEYQRLRPLVESEEQTIRETYPAQEKVARAAGWNDRSMDAYDEYDAHRPAR